MKDRQSFAEQYTAAWCSGDPARVASFFSPRGSLSVNGNAPAVGTQAIADVAAGFMTAFPDLQVLFDGLRMDGDSVQYHWTLTGTYAANGRRVRISGMECWTFGEDGLIAESRGEFDVAEYERQLAAEI